MNLKDLAKTPTLVKVTLDSEDIVAEYGEPLEFYTYDRQPMDVFLKVAANDRQDFSQLVDVLKTMVLDAEGNMVMKDGLILPSRVLVAVFSKMVEVLGK
jgi:hypothetical protein